jgi:hypothetical protein
MIHFLISINKNMDMLDMGVISIKGNWDVGKKRIIVAIIGKLKKKNKMLETNIYQCY